MLEAVVHVRSCREQHGRDVVLATFRGTGERRVVIDVWCLEIHVCLIDEVGYAFQYPRRIILFGEVGVHGLQDLQP